MGGTIRSYPHQDRRIDRDGALVKHHCAILLDTTGPQHHLGMRAQIPIRANHESALAGARRIEDPEEAHAAPGVATAQLDHAEDGRRTYRREQTILFEGMPDGRGWDSWTESAHEVKHWMGPFSAGATTMHTRGGHVRIA